MEANTAAGSLFIPHKSDRTLPSGLGAVDLISRRRRSVDLQSAHAAVGLQIQPTVIKSTARKPGSDVGGEFLGLVMIRAQWRQARIGPVNGYRKKT